MIRPLIHAPLAFLALAAFSAPAFADPDGIRIGTRVIVSPLDELGNLEDISVSRAHARDKTQASANAPDIWIARDPSHPGGGIEWMPAGLIKIGYKAEDRDFVTLRLWSREGGRVFVKDLPSTGADVVATYKVNVGHVSFVLTSNTDGTLNVDGAPVGKIG